MKVIYTGIESSGKSLRLAMQARQIAHRNAKWLKKTGVPRPIFSNLIFSEEFETYVTQTLNIPIQYYTNLEDLVEFNEGDVFIDEVVNYFDARLWADLPRDVRQWLAQGAKSGIQMYGSAQDFSQVDKSFRLLVNEVYNVSKIIGSPRPMKTRPPVKRIWGLCMMRQVDPMSFNGDSSTMKTSGIPNFFLIQKEDCVIFDTSRKIKQSKFPPLKKEIRVCPEDGYQRIRYV